MKIGEGGFGSVYKVVHLYPSPFLALYMKNFYRRRIHFRRDIIKKSGGLVLVQGVLSEGKLIAVKQLSAKSRQGNREFVNEIGMISALQHPNLVKLYGCCVEGNQLILVYEYLENNCLSRALFGMFLEFASL